MHYIIKLILLLLLTTTTYSYSFFSNSFSKASNDNILALTWQANFCKLNSYKRECKKFRKVNFGWNHFVLHGLWPRPRSKQNCSKRYHMLNNKFFQNLKIAMPSAVSGLHKHEWRKHGSCYGKSETSYFNDAIVLLNQINSSKIREFFVRNRGKVITKNLLNMAIKKSFGNTTRKIKLVCKKGLITEIRFSLKGNARKDKVLKLLKNAKAFRGGCQKGKI